MCGYSTANSPRAGFGKLERYDEVLSGAFTSLVGLAFWVFAVLRGCADKNTFFTAFLLAAGFEGRLKFLQHQTEDWSLGQSMSSIFAQLHCLTGRTSELSFSQPPSC
jgi:hypothetical protein